MLDYTEYERAFDWNIADLNHNKITIGEYERKFRQIVDKIRADAIDEYRELIIARIQSKNRGLYVVEAMDIAEVIKEQNNERT